MTKDVDIDKRVIKKRNNKFRQTMEMWESLMWLKTWWQDNQNMAITKKLRKQLSTCGYMSISFWVSWDCVRFGVRSGMSIVKAINVIANANTESLNDITYSNLILGVNTLAGIVGMTKGKSYPFQCFQYASVKQDF